MAANNSPITLVTATPGGGKTALVVQMMKEASEKKRPVFQMGIPELKLPYIPTPPVTEWTELREDPENPGHKLPYFCFPENALIVLDEAQRVYRPRPAASKLPDHVAAFETVRHTGVTFIMITQDPAFLDSHIRKLVGQHIHLIDFGLLGRRYYEWPYAADPTTFKGAPIKKKYVLPKEVFSLYKSSSLHIKRQYTIPPAMMLLGGVVAAGAFLAWYLYGAMNKKLEPATVASQQTSSGVFPVAPGSQKPEVVDVDKMLVEFDPRISGRPETAPAYDGLRFVKQMPQVAGCIQTKKSCTCYTQQATKALLDGMQCRKWLANRPFDAYAEVVQSGEQKKGSGDAKEKPVSDVASAASSPVGSSSRTDGPSVAILGNDSTNPKYNVAMRGQ